MSGSNVADQLTARIALRQIAETEFQTYTFQHGNLGFRVHVVKDCQCHDAATIIRRPKPPAMVFVFDPRHRGGNHSNSRRGRFVNRRL